MNKQSFQKKTTVTPKRRQSMVQNNKNLEQHGESGKIHLLTHTTVHALYTGKASLNLNLTCLWTKEILYTS